MYVNDLGEIRSICMQNYIYIYILYIYIYIHIYDVCIVMLSAAVGMHDVMKRGVDYDMHGTPRG